MGEESRNSWPLITIAFCFNMIPLSTQSAVLFPKLKKTYTARPFDKSAYPWCLADLSASPVCKSSVIMAAKHSSFALFTFCVAISSMFVALASVKLLYLDVLCTMTVWRHSFMFSPSPSLPPRFSFDPVSLVFSYHVCVYVSVRVCIYMHVCTCMYMCACTWVPVWACIYGHIFLCISIK